MAPKKKKSTGKTPIDSLKHDNTRANIPTEELRGFVPEEHRTAKPQRYPRDPSLDPQLVWDGKDEQDSRDLEVPTVPIYIQEHIHPHALIEDFRNNVAKQASTEQLDLFARSFEGDLDFEQKVDFYNHEADWSNRMILGDSLLVMNSLAEKEGLRGKVQCIYIDPPYGIKFGSNWQTSTRKRDVKDGKLEEVTRQPEQIRAFRDTWEKGIHSYLSYLRDRLVVARELLTESGSCFVQIGDENVHRVRCLMDEVFGSENFCSLIIAKKTGGLGTDLLKGVADYVVWYSKIRDLVKYRQLHLDKVQGVGSSTGARYNQVSSPDLSVQRPLTKIEKDNTNLLPEGWRTYRLDNLLSSGYTTSCIFSFKHQKYSYIPGGQRSWKTNRSGMETLDRAGRLQGTPKSLQYVRYLEDFAAYEISNVWDDISVGTDKIYVVQTAQKMLERCILMTTDPGDLVLDPTCGSGTTATVAEQWGRRWITIDTSRVALALARTRLMTAKYPYYLLQDSPEGVQKEAELKARKIPNVETKGDIRKGFVYKTVPHITLKAIANNEEIDEIHGRWQEKLEPCRAELNQLLKLTWEEWEIPSETEKSWTDKAKELHQQWWDWRQQRQQEIDASIARRADQETLYDRPYEDKNRLRVTGPFTVESLSPHRVLDPNGDRPRSEQTGQQQASDQFEVRILENLRTAGVQNTKKNERLKLDTLEPHIGGDYIHAIGQYLDKDGNTREVAVSIGPEYGTVGNDHIREAAKEAVQGIGFDTLVVCGFAFDANVSEQAKKMGRLPVIIARMNPDLLLGDDLLKKTSAANLFTVFGEPDLDIAPQDDGQIVVKLNGLDIYDPTTGQIRSSTTDDIACWFIDTCYNDESFFVRHAYFTGADKPYEKLKKTLKAEIDPDAWSELYSTESRAFAKPETGKIAIKVINHYGDEVLNVYNLA